MYLWIGFSDESVCALREAPGVSVRSSPERTSQSASREPRVLILRKDFAERYDLFLVAAGAGGTLRVPSAGGLSMAIQRGGTFEKGFWHLAALLDPR
jgi:hypothetical protein